MHGSYSTTIPRAKVLSDAEIDATFQCDDGEPPDPVEGVELESLAGLPQWVTWRAEGAAGRKVPYNPAGGPASSTDPATWGTRAAAERRARKIGGGIGLMLGELVDGRGLALVGLDLDACRDPWTGTVAPWAAGIAVRMGTYAEVSPSGTGLKLFGLLSTSSLPGLLGALGMEGGKQRWGRKWTRGTGKHGPAVELYLGQRYFTVTDEWDLVHLLRQLDPDALLELIRTEGGRTVEAVPSPARNTVRDQSRSGDAARMVVQIKRDRGTIDDFRKAVTSDPLTAEWAAEKGEREIERTWARIGVTQTDKAGVPRSNLRNTMLMLRARPAVCGLLAFDEMQCCTMLMHAVPIYSASARIAPSAPRPVEDADVTALLEYLQAAGLPALTVNVLHLAVDARAMECRYHPVREYLDGLAWDGTPRLDGWLTTYLGAEATPYTRGTGRMFLIALAARAFQPGCKVDHMLILEGVQGAGKSAACRILGGPWFSDSLPELTGDAVRVSQHIRGKWLVELAELSAMGKAEASTLKAFVTRQVEDFTPKYGRREVKERRQCAFIGTTNPEGIGYLKDSTGGRRFWPVKVGDVLDLASLARDRDQLFAEAVTAFQAGEQWWPDREFEREHIAPEQETRREIDARLEPIRQWLAESGGLSVRIAEVAREALYITPDRLTLPVQHQIGRCLREAGWVQRRSKSDRWWEHEAG